MQWSLYRWVWQLKAPLFVGMPPAGSLNRCRLYLPARAMHGAVTAELARRNGEEKTISFPDYGKFGKEIGENCRFTYLYPAEQKNGKFLVWLPKYGKAERSGQEAGGLRWFCHDAQDEQAETRDASPSLSSHELKTLLLDSKVSTAVEPETDSALETTLREMEYINPWWRERGEQDEKAKAVFLLGYIFLRKNGFFKKLQEVKILFVGGDTRYGLGKICRVEWLDLQDKPLVFGKTVRLNETHPVITSNFVWGHTQQFGEAQSPAAQGMQELFGGWDLGVLRQGTLSWAPGSAPKKQEAVNWEIDAYGYWRNSI